MTMVMFNLKNSIAMESFVWVLIAKISFKPTV